MTQTATITSALLLTLLASGCVADQPAGGDDATTSGESTTADGTDGASSTGIASTSAGADPSDATGDSSTGTSSGDASTGDASTGDASTGDDATSTGTTDGGTTDASTSEGGDEPWTGCEGGDYLFCDGFEAGSIDGAVWTKTEKENGQIKVDGTRPYFGEGSLHVVIDDVKGSSAYIKTQSKALFPLVGNRFYARVFMYLTPERPNAHSRWISAGGDLDGDFTRYRLDSNNGTLNSRYVAKWADAIEHGGFKKMGNPVPLNRWVCVEWLFDGAKDEVRFWFDGESAPSMTVLGSEDPPWLAPTFSEFEIGHTSIQAPTTADSYDIWYDELVLDDQRIGCG